MSLTKTLEEMKLVRPLAEEDLEALGANPALASTMGVRRGRKLQAIEQLKTLKQRYSDTLMRGAVFILAVGSDAAEFEKIASTEGNCLLSDAESFYKDLAARVHPTLYSGKSTNSNLFDVVGRHLEDKAGELGMTEYPQLIMKDKYSRQVNNENDFMQLLKEAITEQVGGEVVGINAVRQLTDTAIERNHVASTTPILLSTPDQKFAVELIGHLERLSPRVFLVVAGKAPKQLKTMQGAIVVKDANLETVESALTQIKNNLKK